MDEIKKIIKINRPSLSESSIKSYISNLRSINKKLGYKDDEINVNNFKEINKVKMVIENLKPSQRKTLYASLVILFNEDDEIKKNYRTLMMDDIYKVKEEYEEQKEDEDKEYIEWSEVLDVYKNFSKDIKYILNGKDSLKDKEFNLLQNYIILSLYVLLEPRRSMDTIFLKFRNYNVDEDNYVDFKQNKIIFNKYKTAKFYGKQTVEMNKKLKDILKKWYNINSEDYVLIDTLGKPLTQIKLNKKLNSIFGGLKVGVNTLRHSYLTHKYKDLPAFKDMKNTAHNMGHDIEQALLYIKK
jgi:integrase